MNGLMRRNVNHQGSGYKIMGVKFMTIDGSTTKTGVAYFCNGKYKKHYLLDYSKNKDIDQRFETMVIELWKLLNKHKPDIIYMEDIYMANNAKTVRILTRLQGAVYAWCLQNGCEFNTIAPTSWRKLLGFKQGQETRKLMKQQSVQYIYDTYKIEVSDDEADAICIADAVLKKFANNA